MRISAFNRSCERKQSHMYPSKSLKKVTISFDHDPILFSTANPADEVFGRHTPPRFHVSGALGTTDRKSSLLLDPATVPLLVWFSELEVAPLVEGGAVIRS